MKDCLILLELLSLFPCKSSSGDEYQSCSKCYQLLSPKIAKFSDLCSQRYDQITTVLFLEKIEIPER